MGKPRILMVEDSELWRLCVRRMLQEESVDIVGEASDGFQAVKAAERLQPDIILLDIGLPGLNGIEACGWIYRVAPMAKVLFFTEQLDKWIVQAAMNRGAWGYVLKSEAERDLIPAIRSLSADSKFISNRLRSSDHIHPEQQS